MRIWLGAEAKGEPLSLASRASDQLGQPLRFRIVLSSKGAGDWIPKVDSTLSVAPLARPAIAGLLGVSSE